MKIIKTLHLASFDGNIGDNANHDGFYKYLKQNKTLKFKIDELEIREFYWKKKYFDKQFVDLVNSYDLLIIGGGNYFELWVENSPTGTSISIELELLEKIKTPILFNALGVDPGQGASEENIQKFRNFLDLLIKRKDFISIRNDGARKAILEYVGEKYLDNIHHTVDAGFFADIPEPSEYYKSKNYIAINVAYDMQDVRFENITYEDFLKTFKNFIDKFLKEKPTDPFFVMNGDLLTNVNFENMLEFHTKNSAIASMCVREYDLQVPYGVVNIEDGEIKSIEEKPIHKFFVSAGIYMLDPECIDFIPKDEFYDMPTLFERLIKMNKKTISFPLREYWLDIGRIEEYEKANREYFEVFNA